MRDLEGEVVVMDHADIELEGVTAIHVELEELASIDRAIDACGGPVDAIFCFAGASDGAPGIEKINFIGLSTRDYESAVDWIKQRPEFAT